MTKRKKQGYQDKKYLSLVREFPCVCCGSPDTVAHHGPSGGMGMKASDYHTFSLCLMHHTAGGYGIAIHSGRDKWQEMYGTENSHIAETQRSLGYIGEYEIKTS